MSVQSGTLHTASQQQDFVKESSPWDEGSRKYRIEAWQLGWSDDVAIPSEEFVARVMSRIQSLRDQGLFQGYRLTEKDETSEQKPEKTGLWTRFKHSVKKHVCKSIDSPSRELNTEELALALGQGYNKNQLELICPWMGGYRPYGSNMDAWGFKVLPAITAERAQQIMDEAWKRRDVDDIFLARYHQAPIPSINLPEAIEAGWPVPILRLIEHVRGAVNWRHSCGHERLLKAMEAEDLELVQDLLRWQVSPNGSKGGPSPLFLAMSDRPQYIPLLLEHKVDVNIEDEKGDTPLVLALQHHPGLVEDLLTRKADPNKAGASGEPPLMLALRLCPKAVGPLLEAHADPTQANLAGVTPLELAVEKGHDAAILLLLQAAVSPFPPPSYQGDMKHWWGALIRAGASKQLLLTAVKDGDLNLLKALINEGVDVEEDLEGRTALQLAVEKQALDLVKILLEAGADINVLPRHEKGQLIEPVIQGFARELGEQGVQDLLERFTEGQGLTEEAFAWLGYQQRSDGSYTFHYYSPSYPFPALSMDLGAGVSWRDLPLVLKDLESHQLFLNNHYLSPKFLTTAPKVDMPIGDVGPMNLVAEAKRLCLAQQDEISEAERKRVEVICGRLASNEPLNYMSLAEHKRLRNFLKHILKKLDSSSAENYKATALKMMAEMVDEDCIPHCGPGCRRYAQAVWEILNSDSVGQVQAGLLPKIDEIVQRQKGAVLQDILIKGGGGSHSVNFFNYLVQSCEDAGIQFAADVATQERDVLLNRAAQQKLGSPDAVVAQFKARLLDTAIYAIRDGLNERMRQQLQAAHNGENYREDRDFCCPVKKIILEHLLAHELNEVEADEYRALVKKHGAASYLLRTWAEDRLLEHSDLMQCEVDEDLGIETKMTLTLKGAAVLALNAGVVEHS